MIPDRLGAVFLDTSALYAVFDHDDGRYPEAAEAWEGMLRADVPLFTSNYVLVELTALLQRRLGGEAAGALYEFVLPWVGLIWVDETLHREAQAAHRIAGRRDLSMVDCVSFVAMRRLGIKRAFTVDRHFAEQGFGLVPVPTVS